MLEAKPGAPAGGEVCFLWLAVGWVWMVLDMDGATLAGATPAARCGVRSGEAALQGDGRSAAPGQVQGENLQV